MRRVPGLFLSFLPVFFLPFLLFLQIWILVGVYEGVNWETRGTGFWSPPKLFSAQEEWGEYSVEEKVVLADSRLLLLERYLRKYNSPLLDYAGLIFELSQKYGYDYRWIVAIAQQESNLCKKIPEDSHNCWGYGIHKRGTLGFASYREALESFAAYLKREYFDKGRVTPGEMMEKYAPHSSGSWAFGVKQFMDEIEKGD